jgi:hypothetical protein
MSKFEVIKTGVVLDRPVVKDDAVHRRIAAVEQGPPVVGDIARLDDGRLVGRQMFRDCDNSPVFSYAECEPQTLMWREPPAEPPARWLAKINTMIRISPVAPFVSLQSQTRAEFERFRSEWPLVYMRLSAVAQLAVDPSGPTLFPCGETVIRRGAVDRTLVADGMYRNHVAGKFGDFGEYDERPPTEQEIWLDGWGSSPARRNSIAIQTGRGAVESNWPTRGSILTVLAGSHQKTLIIV